MSTALQVGPGIAEWQVWTTTARVVVTDEQTLPAARAAVVAHLAEVDAAASRFRADSEVARIARSTAATHLISPLLADLVRVALDAADASGGDVDPTLGAVLTDLGYGTDLGSGTDVGSGARLSMRRRTRWTDIDLSGRRLTMPVGTLLDLGATAKARAADTCATLLADRFGGGALVSLGGDLRVAGPGPGDGWTVLVQDGPAEPASTVRLTGAQAVATSSTLHRTWRRGGELMHHVLDPVSFRPADPVWRSVTVATGTCVAANTLTTAALVRGRRAPEMVRRAGVAARMVAADGSVQRFGGWPE